MCPTVPKTVTSLKQLPEWAISLPNEWENALVRLDELKAKTSLKLGDVYIYEVPMGKRTWKITVVEVLNANEIRPGN